MKNFILFLKFIQNYILLLKSDFFDSKYYLTHNEDVKKAKVNPILHYLKFGWKEGRNPSPLFNTKDYLSLRPDVKKANLCPLVHYELVGKKELLSLSVKKIAELEKLKQKIAELEKLKQKIAELEKLKQKIAELEKSNHKILSTYSIGINKEKISFEIEKFLKLNQPGITDEKREPELIVSLTSYPGRIYDIHYCIFSLLNQTLKPNKIILWLGEEQFPNRNEDLPQKLLELTKYGLTIEYTKDIKSYKKLIPALRKFPDAIIVTADDDIFYPNNWLEKLYNGYLNNPNLILAHRARKLEIENKELTPYCTWKIISISNKSSYYHFFTGVGGVLYPPNSLYKDIFNEELFMKLTNYNDDIWFWAMSVLNDTKTKILDEPINTITYINAEREMNLNDDGTLYSTNKARNDTQLENIVNYYPQIMQKLLSETN